MQRWKNEKEIVDTIQNIKKEIEELEHQAEVAERESDYEKVAKIRYGDLKEKEAMLWLPRKNWRRYLKIKVHK